MLVYYQFNTCSALNHHLLFLAHLRIHEVIINRLSPIPLWKRLTTDLTQRPVMHFQSCLVAK